MKKLPFIFSKFNLVCFDLILQAGLELLIF